MINFPFLTVRLIIFVLLITTLGCAPVNTFGFAHPGLLNSEGDLARIKAAVAAKEEPIFSGYEVFRKHVESQATYVMKGPRTAVGRGAGWDGAAQSVYDADANAAYQCAIMWIITGDQSYAEKSKQILNAWSATLKTIGGRDAVLGAGLGPFKMVNAAEIIRYSHAGWSDADIKQAENCFKGAIYPVIKDFAPFANGNWDTAAIKTVIAIGVFCNDRDIYERGLRYYVNGAGDGRLTRYIINEAGECQETGRDSQHSQLGLAHLGDACEIAWNQGLNLYGYANNRLLAGFEYTAAHNGGVEVPFVEWMDRTGDSHYLRTSAPGNYRMIYEEIYNHYVNRMGLTAPFTQKAAESIRPEGQGVRGIAGINGADHIGFGTLLYSRAKATRPLASALGVPSAPGAIIADGGPDAIKLTWIESIGAQSYTVKRTSVQGGPYTIVAKDVEGSRYNDKTVQPGGVYFYVVSATSVAGESADGYETGICASLPRPWKQLDIGNVVATGSSKFDGAKFTLEGGGSDIGGTNDQLQFAYTMMEGNGTITARYVPQVSSQHLKFGLMMRETTSPESASVSYLIRRDDAHEGRAGWSTALLARPTAGANAIDAKAQPLGGPTVTENRLLNACWLRLSRAGDTFTASFSTDGMEWTTIGTTAVSLKSRVLVGIGACSRLVSKNVSATTTVMMDHVEVKGGTNSVEEK